MKKFVLLIVVMMGLGRAFGGEIGLPVERVALPVVEGDFLICIWDDASEQWIQNHITYDHSGVYTFQVPAWENWYWIGLWDRTRGEYVFGKWIGHFVTD